MKHITYSHREMPWSHNQFSGIQTLRHPNHHNGGNGGGTTLVLRFQPEIIGDLVDQARRAGKPVQRYVRDLLVDILTQGG